MTAKLPLRVGLDAREAFRHNPRGIGLYARHLMRELGELRPDAEFLLYHERETPADLPPIPAGMRPVRCDMPGGRLHVFERVLMPLRAQLDKLAVYHGTYNTLPPRVPFLRRTPMVVTIHDLIVTWYDDDLHDPYVRYCRAVTPRVVRDARIILTVSEWSRRDILERFDADPDKVRVFHNGVHPDFLRDQPPELGERARQTCAGGRRYLFTVGASLARKNTAGLLDALALLHRRRPLEHLLLVSGLDEQQRRPFAEQAARQGLGTQVRFLPYLSRAELIALYAGADLFVYPSLLEGWGIPVVEALATGTPVATSRTSGILEAGGEHAAYFDPGDLEDMAATIERALDPQSAFALVRDAAMQRARSFTWRRAAEVTLQAYRDAAR